MKILVADDHNLVRDGLKPFLQELGPDVTVIDAATLDEALAKATEAGDVTLALLDLRMPGMDGTRGIEVFRSQLPAVRVVILTGHVARDDVLAALKAGAAGYIPKTVSGTSLINALRLVLSGETYLPSSVFAADPTPDPADAPRRASPDPANPLATLSPREREILGFLIDGDTNKEIARRLELQEITIKIHLRNVYRKIGAANRAQAVRIAMASGFQLNAPS